MKKATVRVCFLPAVFLLASNFAQAQTLNLDQIADGGVWQTTIVLTNTSANQAIVTLNFFKDTGGGNTSSWNLAFVENVQASALILGPGSTQFLHTQGSAATTTIGWAQISELDGSGSVVAYAIFTLRGAGAGLQNGTAQATAAVSRVLMPFDNTGPTTNMSIVNTTSSSETINVGIRTASSTTQPSAITLPANGHMPFAFPTQFPSTAGQSGLAEFYAPSGSFSILALRGQNTGFTTAPVYNVTGPPLFASSSSGGGNTAGNIVMAGFNVGKINTTTGDFTSGSITDLLGGQFASYTPAEWQLPFSSTTVGPCSVLDVTYPVGSTPPYSPSSYLDAGTITATGPNLPPGFTLTPNPFSTVGPTYFFMPGTGVTLALGGKYTLSNGSGGSQVGPFTTSATLPSAFAVTGWDTITSINRGSGLTLNWTGSGFDTVTFIALGSTDANGTIHGVTVACTVHPAGGSGSLTIPAAALASLPAGTGQLEAAAQIASATGTASAVSTTARDLVPNLVGGGQVNYGFFAPSLTLVKSVSIQ